MTPGLERAYRDRRVLVTGHTGFKGAWLSAWLQRLGARVVGYALPAEHGSASLYQAARIGDGMVSLVGDVRDTDRLCAVYREHQPEVVFHLAAQALVRRGYRDPVGTFATNVMGTVHVLDGAREAPTVRAIVVVTSDKCYEHSTQRASFRESDRLGGDDPYSSSKGCAELVVAAYRRSYFPAGRPAVASARAGNVIGGGDWGEDRLVPDLMRAAAAGRQTVLRNPDAVRPWQHVLDPLYGYLLLGSRLLEEGAPWAEAWNFGPAEGEAVAVGDLARRIAARWDRVRTVVDQDPTAPREAEYLQLDATKARTRLGWAEHVGLDDAIAWTVDWYRRGLADPASAADAVAGQLSAYAERVTAP